MTILDCAILAVILLWLISAVYYIIRQRKAGRSVSCGSGCSGCRKHCGQAGVKR